MSQEPSHRLYICHGAFCRGDALYRALQTLLQQRQQSHLCELRASGCQSRCDDGPNITVWPGPTRYHHVTDAVLPHILDAHLPAHADTD